MKLNKILFATAAAALTLGFTSCSDKEETPAVGITAATITPDGSSVTYVLAPVGDDMLDNSADPVAWDVTDAAMAEAVLKVTPTLNTIVTYNGEEIGEGGITVDATKPVVLEAVNGTITKSVTLNVVRATEAAEGLVKKATLDPTNVIWRDFAYYKGKFYAFIVKNTIIDAETGDAREDYLLQRSTDGVTWTDVDYTIDVENEVLAGEGAHFAIFNDKLYVLTGQRIRGTDKYGNAIEADDWGWGPLYDIYKWRAYETTDGENFKSLEAASTLERDGEASAISASSNTPFGNVFVFKNKLFMQGGYMFGFGQQQTSTTVLKSSDGLNWARATIVFTDGATAVLPNNCAIFELGGKLFSVGGYRNFINAKNICATVYSSADGETWETVAEAATGIPALYQAKVVSNGTKAFLFGGEYLGEDGETRVINNKVYSSTDGINWTEVATPDAYKGSRFPQAFIVGNALWLFDGDGTVSQGSYPAPQGTDTYPGNIWNMPMK